MLLKTRRLNDRPLFFLRKTYSAENTKVVCVNGVPLLRKGYTNSNFLKSKQF